MHYILYPLSILSILYVIDNKYLSLVVVALVLFNINYKYNGVGMWRYGIVIYIISYIILYPLPSNQRVLSWYDRDLQRVAYSKNVSDATLKRDGKQPPQRVRPPKKKSFVVFYSVFLIFCDDMISNILYRAKEESDGGGNTKKEEKEEKIKG